MALITITATLDPERHISMQPLGHNRVFIIVVKIQLYFERGE